MGAGPSLGKFLKSMDDDELGELVETAYKLEPQRLDKMFALAKMRYYEESGQQPHQETDTTAAAVALSLPAALLTPHSSTPSSSAPLMLTEMMPSSSAAATPSLPGVVPSATTTEVMAITETTTGHSVMGGSKDPMNALWTFEGHHLREMQTADKNPHNANQQSLHTGHLGKNAGGLDPSAGAMTPSRELEADGYPVMYGSCGREKRYGRCSVCYFRGLRCNTAHYCACCQRAVCIRPRKYPGEEHPKICWNVLHVDKEMIQRVERKKKRKLQALTAAATAATSVHESAASRLKNDEACNAGEGDADHSDRPNDNLNQSAEDLHRAPSIPTVVADVSGAVDL